MNKLCCKGNRRAHWPLCMTMNLTESQKNNGGYRHFFRTEALVLYKILKIGINRYKKIKKIK